MAKASFPITYFPVILASISKGSSPSTVFKASALMPSVTKVPFSIPPNFDQETTSSPETNLQSSILPCTRQIGGTPKKVAANRFLGSSYSSWGFAICWTTPLFRRTISSEIDKASSWSCVTKIAVTWVSVWILRISSLISSLSLASRLDNGSSKSRIFGSFANALAIATLCCWPPDSCPGFLFINSSTLTSLASSYAFSSLSFFLSSFLLSRGKHMFSFTVI